MFDLDKLDQARKLAPRYTIATCWAPAATAAQAAGSNDDITALLVEVCEIWL